MTIQFFLNVCAEFSEFNDQKYVKLKVFEPNISEETEKLPLLQEDKANRHPKNTRNRINNITCLLSLHLDTLSVLLILFQTF